MASTAAITEPGAAAAHRYLVFEVGGRLFGCDIALVREIVPFRRCTRLPGAPEYVCGLINLRGTVVTVLDLGLRLGGAPVSRDDGAVVLVEHGARLVGLGVDGLRDVQRVAPEELEAAGARGGWGGGAVGNGDPAGGAVRGVARAGDAVVVLLDAAAIITQALL